MLRLVIPLAVLAALASWSIHAGDGSVETGYLALLATGVVAAASFLAPRPAPMVGIGASLVVLLGWVLPPGPERGAAISSVLVGLLALAAARRLVRWVRAGAQLPAAFLVAGLVPLCLGLQLLLRAERLIGVSLDARTLGGLVVLPLVAAACVASIGRFHLPAALLAGAAVLPLTPGWSVATTMVLLALAAGELLGRLRTLELAGWLRGAVVGGAGLALVAPVGFEVASGGLALAAGATRALLVAGVRRRFVLLPALAVLLAAELAALRSWGEALGLLPGLLILLPAALVPDGGAGGKRRFTGVGAAVLLAAAAGRGVGLASGPGLAPLLAAPVALAALSLPGPRVGDELSPRLAVQGVWSVALLALSTLLATYPWLRSDPLGEALRLLGLPALTWSSALVLFVLVSALVVLSRWPRLRRGLVPMVLLALLTALATQLPGPAAVLVDGGPVTLTERRPVWRAAVDGTSVRSLVIDTNLAFAAGLSRNTPVATVRLGEEADGETWTLSVGRDTGEWAAARPDVVAARGRRAPQPWLSWVAPDGTFFAQRYRQHLRLDAVRHPHAVEIRRREDLPAEVELVVYQVELRSR